ncbi:unnamed protein product [Dibothriocephalus latus]|uniref:Uncharacterized protein n=1 Tax=Dibothriocephalus latus TaxID=60516 RepID=A0A3P6QRU8_DIBLA|nr:unnamed protein product [Dibothriocephalus latus]
MPANSQFVSQGPQFGTEPGLRTGSEKTSVGSPTSADSQVKSQSETDNFPGLTTAFGSASITDHMPENSQFVPQEPRFGTEPSLRTGNEKTSVVPPISTDVEMDIQVSDSFPTRLYTRTVFCLFYLL